ncbi:hypothetical protein ElyMa_006785700 [Elysia marginata]|uniref:Uncharacterized protein n=1 Tax=Elysia marginata TaxID=1093978 RepID=A0AAV4J517_9GAST|nr:hypothetical protein ElyMa_006785700 [Elysia marginata]
MLLSNHLGRFSPYVPPGRMQLDHHSEDAQAPLPRPVDLLINVGSCIGKTALGINVEISDMRDVRLTEAVSGIESWVDHRLVVFNLNSFIQPNSGTEV